MNTEISNAAICYGLYDGENIVGFMGVLHQPHGIRKNLKRVSRLVILPDYQGIGLARAFLDFIAKKYTNDGFLFSIVTSAKNLIIALRKDKNWILNRYDLLHSPNSKSVIDHKRATIRKVKTAGFIYQGG